MSHLDSQTGPSGGLASKMCCRRQASQAPNCISLGDVNLTVEAFTDGVSASGSALEL